MLKYWSEIPKVFRLSMICAICLEIVLSLGAGIVKNAWFGVQTAIMGGFSVALLCVYVVWVGRLMGHTKAQIESAETDKDKENVATGMANRIQIASLLKMFVLAGFIIFCVLVFRVDIIAAILGVSVIYVPLFVVPLFVKSEPAEAVTQDSQPAKSEVK